MSAWSAIGAEDRPVDERAHWAKRGVNNTAAREADARYVEHSREEQARLRRVSRIAQLMLGGNR